MDVVARKVRECRANLVVLRLGFLQADYIGIDTGYCRHEVFFHDGTDAIHIPGNNSHGVISTEHITGMLQEKAVAVYR
jgi:hypothetical protein